MSAQKNEAEGVDTIDFEHDGVSYTVAREINLDVLEALEDDKPLSAARAILGAEQWKKFRAGHSKPSDLSDLFEAYNRAVGAPNS